MKEQISIYSFQTLHLWCLAVSAFETVKAGEKKHK